MYFSMVAIVSNFAVRKIHFNLVSMTKIDQVLQVRLRNKQLEHSELEKQLNSQCHPFTSKQEQIQNI
jgi:hypothetical protein